MNQLENECQETTGLSANKLKTCPDTAKFIQCFFGKARKLAAEKKEEKQVVYLDETSDSGIKTTKTTKLPNGRVVLTKKP